MATTKVTESAAEQAAETVTQKAAQNTKEAGTVVYCGPTVRNVVQQFTVFNGELPKPLADWLETHKTAKSLLVPLARFAQTRAALEEPGSVAFVLFNTVKAQIQKEG